MGMAAHGCCRGGLLCPSRVAAPLIRCSAGGSAPPPPGWARELLPASVAARRRPCSGDGNGNGRGRCGWRSGGSDGCSSARHGSAVFTGSNGTVSETYDSVATEPDDGLCHFVFDGVKLTAVAHLVWHRIVKAGDTVIDATCGNGHDTLILARLVSRDSQQGHVYGFDLQQSALDKTSLLLDKELTPFQRQHVKLHQMCHSRLDEVMEDFDSVRMVAFNLGYLPGGNKSIITQATTTLSALKCAKRIVKPGGLISMIAYVGHEGGREEYDAVKKFAASLPTENWVCSHFEWMNRPISPHLMFLFRK